MSRLLFTYKSFELLEPYEGKLSRTVLRGESGSNAADLLDKAIATPEMAGYIKYFFKTIRKFFGEAMVVTQEIDDIISSPIVRDAIINNADTRILLDMGKFKNKFDLISQSLGLSDFQKEQVLSINKNLPSNRKLKEVFIAQGENSNVFALEVSRPEYYCYTSEQKEKELILQKLKETNGGESFLEILKSM